MSDDVTLTDRLAEAAHASVMARRGAIEAGDARNLRAITVELELANNGAVVDVTCHLSWKSVVRQATRGSS